METNKQIFDKLIQNKYEQADRLWDYYKRGFITLGEACELIQQVDKELTTLYVDRAKATIVSE